MRRRALGLRGVTGRVLFRRVDSEPWSLAGLWNNSVDKATGEVHVVHTVLTLNADHHPLMTSMRLSPASRRLFPDDVSRIPGSGASDADSVRGPDRPVAF